MHRVRLAMMAATAAASVFVAWAALFGTPTALPMGVAASESGSNEAKDSGRRPGASTPRIFADGIVEGANQELSLRFEVPGRIKAVHVREGEVVKAGDVLAELETDAAELQLADSQIRLKIAMAERDQLVGETMRRTREVTREPRADAAKPQLSREQQAIADGKTDLALTAVRRDQLLLDKCRLRAPNDGVVLRVVPQAGELTGPDDQRELFTIVSHGAMRVRAFIEELDGLRVCRGQRAVVSAAGEPHTPYLGTIAACSLYFRPKSQRLLKPGERLDLRVREVVIDLDDGHSLLIGLPVEVFIEP